MALAVLVIALAFGLGFLIGAAPWSGGGATQAVNAAQPATISTFAAPTVPGLKAPATGTTTTVTTTSTRTSTSSTGTTGTPTTTSTCGGSAQPVCGQNDCDHNGYAGCAQHPCGFHNPCTWIRPRTIDAALPRTTPERLAQVSL
jgi:hypothetical protein